MHTQKLKMTLYSVMFVRTIVKISLSKLISSSIKTLKLIWGVFIRVDHHILIIVILYITKITMESLLELFTLSKIEVLAAITKEPSWFTCRPLYTKQISISSCHANSTNFFDFLSSSVHIGHRSWKVLLTEPSVLIGLMNTSFYRSINTG